MAKKKYTFIDLFAGCGGLSCGLEQAGFQPCFANELVEMFDGSLYDGIQCGYESQPYGLREMY